MSTELEIARDVEKRVGQSFAASCIQNGSCGVQSYILYKVLEKKGISSRIVPGYIIRKDCGSIAGHFWVVLANGVVLDPQLYAYKLTMSKETFAMYVQGRELVEEMTEEHDSFELIDNDIFLAMRAPTLRKWLAGGFENDIKQNCDEMMAKQVLDILETMMKPEPKAEIPLVVAPQSKPLKPSSLRLEESVAIALTNKINPNAKPVKDSARIVGGMRRPTSSLSKKVKPALLTINELLNHRDYQTSREIPDLTSIEFLSDLESHKKIVNPMMRISSKLNLLLISGKLVDMDNQEKKELIMPVLNNNDSQSNKEKEKENKYVRRFKPVFNKAMKNYTVVELKDIKLVKVIIQNSMHVVNNAKVFQVGKCFLVWGSLVMSGTARPPQLSAPNSFTNNNDSADNDSADNDSADNDKDTNNNATATATVTDVDKDDDFNIPDGATFTQNDVEIVCENTGCSKNDAIHELVYNNGELINTILAFSIDKDGISPALTRAEARKKS